MNDEVSRSYGYIRSLAKQIQSYFDNSLHCHDPLVRMQILGVLCLRHAIESLWSSSLEQTDTTLLANNTQHSWMLMFRPFARPVGGCCHAKFKTGQTFSLEATFLANHSQHC